MSINKAENSLIKNANSQAWIGQGLEIFGGTIVVSCAIVAFSRFSKAATGKIKELASVGGLGLGIITEGSIIVNYANDKLMMVQHMKK